ncbi:hypothetical protein K438DRAFT_1674921 [Mycena galopus ATCC 62051]|nr:hypothetical protein K438DRAFT_1674921 [Mycena galopus ATCC 62051]
MMFSTLLSLLIAAVRAAPLLERGPSQNASQYQYITLEEHCVPESLAGPLQSNEVLQLLINGTFGPYLISNLTDANITRIASMNANNIRIQVVNNNLFDSTNATAAVISNNGIYENFTSPHPDRLRAFCSLAMGEPEAAAQELERCVIDLGFVGGMANAALSNGTFYDSPTYWSVFATAERLGVPIYIHPSFPPTSQVLTVGGQYAPAVKPDGTLTFNDFIAANLASTVWGFESGAGLSFMRLYSAGLFDTYPQLKLILGHMGEMVPYMLERSDYFVTPLTAPRKSLRQVYADNVWVTTSGFFWLDQVPTLLRTTALDRIMFSVDTPFNTNPQGSQFLEKLRDSSLVTETEFEGIAFRNAETLLNLTTGN